MPDTPGETILHVSVATAFLLGGLMDATGALVWGGLLLAVLARIAVHLVKRRTDAETFLPQLLLLAMAMYPAFVLYMATQRPPGAWLGHWWGVWGVAPLACLIAAVLAGVIAGVCLKRNRHASEGWAWIAGALGVSALVAFANFPTA